jgi:ribosomal protein L11 methyltransferase
MSASLRVVVDGASAEIVADRLWQVGALAIEERTGSNGDTTLVAGFATVTGASAAAEVCAPWPAVVEEVDDGAGLDAWRPFAEPWRAGRNLVVSAPWIDAGAGPGDVVVIVDPGHAFGSGSHPSTRLALAHLERRIRPGDRVADIGCGSGVLAIAAALLGAGHVDAVDVDRAAVDATATNASANGVAERVRASQDQVDSLTGGYDLVVANIGATVLRDLAPAIGAIVRPGGHLVLAGLLDDRGAEVIAAYPGLAVVEVTVEDGWAAPVLRRNGGG